MSLSAYYEVSQLLRNLELNSMKYEEGVQRNKIESSQVTLFDKESKEEVGYLCFTFFSYIVGEMGKIGEPVRTLSVRNTLMFYSEEEKTTIHLVFPYAVGIDKDLKSDTLSVFKTVQDNCDSMWNVKLTSDENMPDLIFVEAVKNK